MTEKRKKRLLYHSDGAWNNTGFSKTTKSLLKELYKTGKYEIFNYCCSAIDGDPNTQRTPWISIGCLPNNQAAISELNSDPTKARQAAYGQLEIDKIIQEVKPDVYIAVNDIWAASGFWDKPWFNKICSVIHTTLDSLPLLPESVSAAPKIKNYWQWSEFSTEEMHRLGHEHVKTVHGCLDLSKFYPLERSKKVSLRVENNIEVNAFVIGFAFRNQLRKSIDKLLSGYKLWKETYKPSRPTYLCLLTSLTEGWNIHSYCEEIGVDKKEVLIVYVCKNCKKYEVRAIDGQDLQCKYCQTDNQVTTSVRFGITDEQLNEYYSLLNCYVHPANSGATEWPIIESASAGVGCISNPEYAYGYGHIKTSNGLIQKLEFDEVREFGTQFRKAVVRESSIASVLEKFYSLTEQEREDLGKKTRQWALDNFDSKKIAKFIENFIDEQPFVDYNNFTFEEEEKDPNAQIDNLDNDIEWVKQLYKKVLKTDVNEKDEGLKHWIERLSRDLTRQQVENYFRQIARDDNQKNKTVDFSDLLDKNDDKKILFVIPDSIGDVYLCTSLFGSIKEMYPEYALYVATNQNNFDVLKGNENIKKVVPYIPNMDQLILLEGQRGHKGHFDIAFLPHVTTQRMLTYLHNGQDRIEFDINKD